MPDLLDSERRREASRFATPSAALALVLLATYVVYAPALRFGFVWDDAALILDDPRLRDLGQTWALLTKPFWGATPELRDMTGYYRPVVSLAYLLEYQLFGPHPFGYHVVALALHLACTALAFAWLRDRLARTPAGNTAPAALAAAACGTLFFALHPSKPESAAWISGGTDAWMTLFLLLCVHAARRGRSVACALCAVLALLSKENAVVVPALIALDALWLPAAAHERRAALRAAAAAAVALALVLVLRFFLVPVPERLLVDLWRDLPVRVLSSLGEYIAAGLLPDSPTVLRGRIAYARDGSLALSHSSIALGVLGALLAGALVALARKRASLRPVVADLAWFLLPLLPVLNLLPLRLEALVAERFLYLPSLGLAALLARVVARLGEDGSARARKLPVVLCVLVALALGLVSVRRVHAFENDRTLWLYEYERDNSVPYVLFRLVNQALMMKQPEQASELAREGYLAARRDRQRPYEVRFVLLSGQAAALMTSDADQAGLRALRDFYDALGDNRQAQLRFPTFAISARFGKELTPLVLRDPQLYALPRAMLYARTGELERATTQLQAALRASPEDTELRNQLAIVLARAARTSDALRVLRDAPPTVRQRASLQATRLRVERAASLRDAPSVDPAERAVRDAQAFVILGAFSMARQALDDALVAQPDHVELVYTRALVDAADQNAELARERIAAARRALPQASAMWDRTSAEIDALTAPAAPSH